MPQQQVATCSNKRSLDPQGTPPTPLLTNEIDRIYIRESKFPVNLHSHSGCETQLWLSKKTLALLAFPPLEGGDPPQVQYTVHTYIFIYVCLYIYINMYVYIYIYINSAYQQTLHSNLRLWHNTGSWSLAASSKQNRPFLLSSVAVRATPPWLVFQPSNTPGMVVWRRSRWWVLKWSKIFCIWKTPRVS